MSLLDSKRDKLLWTSFRWESDSNQEVVCFSIKVMTRLILCILEVFPEISRRKISCISVDEFYYEYSGSRGKSSHQTGKVDGVRGRSSTTSRDRPTAPHHIGLASMKCRRAVFLVALMNKLRYTAIGTWSMNIIIVIAIDESHSLRWTLDELLWTAILVAIYKADTVHGDESF